MTTLSKARKSVEAQIFHHLTAKCSDSRLLKPLVSNKLLIGQKTECDSFYTQRVSSVLETPEELQGQFVSQEHGGAHWEASDGVDRRSTEENVCSLRPVAVDDTV